MRSGQAQVIDLSHDETPAKRFTHLRRPVSPCRPAGTTEEFVVLSDDSSSIIVAADVEWQDHAERRSPKRQRKSDSPVSRSLLEWRAPDDDFDDLILADGASHDAGMAAFGSTITLGSTAETAKRATVASLDTSDAELWDGGASLPGINGRHAENRRPDARQQARHECNRKTGRERSWDEDEFADCPTAGSDALAGEEGSVREFAERTMAVLARLKQLNGTTHKLDPAKPSAEISAEAPSVADLPIQGTKCRNSASRGRDREGSIADDSVASSRKGKATAGRGKQPAAPSQDATAVETVTQNNPAAGAGSSVSARKGKAAARRGKEPAVASPEAVTAAVEAETQDKAADARREREREKQRQAAEKAAAKAAEQERKRLEREEKARAKEAAAELARANRSKTDKKASTPEMIVDLPDSWGSSSGPSSASARASAASAAATDALSALGTQLRSFLANLGVEATTYAATVPNVVKWRRKTTAVFNEERGLWEPVPEVVRDERHIMCVMGAQEFVNLVSAATPSVSSTSTSSSLPPTAAAGTEHRVRDDSQEEGAVEDLGARVARLRQAYGEQAQPVFLIEGLAAWMRKNKNVRNRAYQAAVRQGMAGGGDSGGSGEAGADVAAATLRSGDGRRRAAGGAGAAGAETTTAPASTAAGRARRKQPNTATKYVDEEVVENGLLRLQVVHRCLIHHTNSTTETAEWISIFTQHISTIPYRAERMNLATSFCMDTGQVRTGADRHDTYLKMLQQIVRVTAPVAHGIAAQYPDVQALVQAFRDKGPMALQHVKKSANQNGAFTNVELGPALSKRVCHVFTSTNAASYDV